MWDERFYDWQRVVVIDSDLPQGKPVNHEAPNHIAATHQPDTSLGEKT
ncbi:hypothetical protein [Nitrospira sp. M1]